MGIATREAYGKALAEYGKDENIVVLDADLSKSTKTDMFKTKYPERFFNMGIAEGNMMSVAAGIASTGKTVFASSFAVFASLRACEQIRNSICYPNLNVKIGATHAGISVGEDGASHQAIEDIAVMRSIPNMVVMSPADEVETKCAIKAAIDYDGPVYIRLGRLAVEDVFDEATYKFELGKAVTVTESDNDCLTIMTTGLMLQYAVEAAKIMKEEGKNVRVVNFHTIKPIDKEIIIKAAKETGKILTVEEHNVIGGLGGAVSEVVTESCPVIVKKMGIMDTFGKSGSPKALLKMYGLTTEDIVKNIKEMI